MPDEAGQQTEGQETQESNVNYEEKLLQMESAFQKERQDIIARRDKATKARREAFELLNQVLPDGNKIDLNNPNLDSVRDVISNINLSSPGNRSKGNNTNNDQDFSAKLEKEIQPLKEQMSQLEQMAQRAIQERDNFMLGNTIRDKVLQNGGAKGPLEAVTRMLKDMLTVDTESGSAKVVVNRDAAEAMGYRAVKVDNGHDVVPVSVDEFIQEFLPKNPWALEGAGGGSGSNGSRNGKAEVSMSMFEGLTPDQQREAYHRLTPEQKQSIKNQSSLSGKKDKVW